LFQKEHEQRRRRKSKAQFFEMIQEIRRYAWVLADLYLIFIYLKHQFIFCHSFVQIIILSRKFRASEISPSQGGNGVSMKAEFGVFKDKVEVNCRQKTSICSWNREVFVSNDSCICLNSMPFKSILLGSIPYSAWYIDVWLPSPLI
jgi:hypothetical protein